MLYRLQDEGYTAYLVGGCVRDLLCGLHPKDFDVATNATPEQVRDTFRNCRLIGRRFRLAHVHFGREIIEVATFRASANNQPEAQVCEDSGRILRDNVYGSIEEDAIRRDFTINGLYYSVADFAIHDHTNGMADIRAKQIRLIGDPVTRYREDPVRMLRTLRFAAKLGFSIHPDTEAPLYELGPLLDDIPTARLFEEVLKLFHSGQAQQTFALLRQYGLFQYLFPATDDELTLVLDSPFHALIQQALASTDARINAGKSVTPAFLFAIFLWEPTRQHWQALMQDDGMPPAPALQVAASAVLDDQAECTSIPKRLRDPIRAIWQLQPRFEQRNGKRALRLLEQPRFRAAYDFLVLRAEVGDADAELAQWWTEFQTLDAEAKDAAMQAFGPDKRGRRRRRRKSPNKPESGNPPANPE